MSDRYVNAYEPDHAVPPGDVLLEYLEHGGMTQADLADRTGLARKTVNEIIRGKAPITPETALRLERVLGRPAHFWNALEMQFRESTVRLAEREKLAEHLEWLAQVPVRAMVRMGWIESERRAEQQLERVLEFFGVASPDQWSAVWSRYDVAYRRAGSAAGPMEAVTAWLRQGEREAARIVCAPYSQELFRAMLEDVRSLTRMPPSTWSQRLRDACAAAGVAVVFIPELPGCLVYGATRWLHDRPVIQLSLRRRSDDHLWFTFFHEAGHILRHGRKDLFIEADAVTDEREQEADAFARDTLIPRIAWREFLRAGTPTLDMVEAVAASLGIAPGIVVGRLQHDGILPHSVGNRLKVYFDPRLIAEGG
jgi:addiction module HigA family antidote